MYNKKNYLPQDHPLVTNDAFYSENTYFLFMKSTLSLQKVSSERTTSHVYNMHEFYFTDSFDNITIKHGGLCVLCNL